MKRIAEEEAKAKAEKELEEVKAKIIEFFTANKTSLDVIKPVLELCRANNYNNPTEIDNIEFAKQVLELCK